MRGIGYAAVEIVILLLLSAVIGFFIGWVMRRWTGSSATPAVNSYPDPALRKKFEEQTKTLAVTRGQLDDYSDRVAALEAELARRTSDSAGSETVDAMRAQLLEAESKAKASQARIATLEDQLEVLESGADPESAESDASADGAALADALEASEAARARADQLEEELAATKADLAELRGHAGELEAAAEAVAGAPAGDDPDSVTAQLLESKRHNEDLERQLAGARKALDAANARSHELESQARSGTLEDPRIRELEAAVAERESRIAELEETIESHASAAEERGSDLETQDAAPTESDLPDKDTALARVAEIAARTGAAGEPVDDDLKLIHGIGPKIEDLLKSMGITSFRQIAAFRPDDIDHVTVALDAFPGRIEKDGWVGSAAQLHRDTYGDAV